MYTHQCITFLVSITWHRLWRKTIRAEGLYLLVFSLSFCSHDQHWFSERFLPKRNYNKKCQKAHYLDILRDSCKTQTFLRRQARTVAKVLVVVSLRYWNDVCALCNSTQTGLRHDTKTKMVTLPASVTFELPNSAYYITSLSFQMLLLYGLQQLLCVQSVRLNVHTEKLHAKYSNNIRTNVCCS